MDTLLNDGGVAYSSSPPSSPPSALSDPGSPSLGQGRANIQMSDVIVEEASTPNGQPKRYAIIDGKQVQLTVAGVPRKKPGRKPGAQPKPRNPDDPDAPKKRQRKPRDPDAPPVQRKRKVAPQPGAEIGADSKSLTAPPALSLQPTAHNMMAASPAMAGHADPYSQKAPKREALPSSMRSILNDNTEPVRTSGQNYDPIRGNYDPVRGTMVYGAGPASPRPASNMNSASASPSIASLVGPSTHHNSFGSNTFQARPHAPEQPPVASPAAPLAFRAVPEAKKPPPVHKAEQRAKDTTLTAGSSGKKASKQKPNTAGSSPKNNGDDTTVAVVPERSILDFGKAKPGEELQAPTIVLDISIQPGETNKYVNFLRLAEDQYGWDALHPRLAANRDRKARIAAATAALDKTGSGRDTGDEMSEELSEVGDSNVEVGASGIDVPVKPVKKKRNFKEDEYDVGDDFVDDSEMLWESQAAASKDGFFVYSGPLVQEPEKPVKPYVLFITHQTMLTYQARGNARSWAWTRVSGR